MRGPGNEASVDTEGSLHLAHTLREGTRSELLGALALIAIAGVIAGRRLQRDE